MYSPNYTQDGFTALTAACFYGNTDIARMLLDRGAVVDHFDKVKYVEL